MHVINHVVTGFSLRGRQMRCGQLPSLKAHSPPPKADCACRALAARSRFHFQACLVTLRAMGTGSRFLPQLSCCMLQVSTPSERSVYTPPATTLQFVCMQTCRMAILYLLRIQLVDELLAETVLYLKEPIVPLFSREAAVCGAISGWLCSAVPGCIVHVGAC